MKIRCTCRFRL